MSDAPEWTNRGGSFRNGYTPQAWFKKRQGNQIGQWNRKELIPYGRAPSEYRERYYVCPECASALFPLEREYRFACSACRLIFAWGFGGLYGYGKDHEKAELEP